MTSRTNLNALGLAYTADLRNKDKRVMGVISKQNEHFYTEFKATDYGFNIEVYKYDDEGEPYLVCSSAVYDED